MTEVKLMAPVKATWFVGDFGNTPTPPGAIQTTADFRGLFYMCPCGCGKPGYLQFRSVDPSVRPSWLWDPATVTLAPSVHDVGHWHGWLIRGEWTEA